MLENKIKFILFAFLALLGITSCTSPATPDLLPEHGAFTGLPSIDAITKDIIADPNNMALRVARCEAYSDEGMLLEAEGEARLIWEHDKTNWKSSRMLAWAYFDNNKSKPALKILEQALEIYPDTIHLLLVHSEINLKVQQYDEALVSAEKVLKLEPLNVEGLFMKGLTMKYIGDTASAVTAFQTAIEQNADHIDAYMQLADIFAAAKEKIAIQYYDNALRIDSLTYEALMGKASFYHQNYTNENGLLPKVKEAYERVILHHPQEVDALFNYGLFYMEEENYEQAQHFFDITIKYDPQFGDAYYFKGEALEKLGRTKEAVTAYENAVQNKNRFGRAEEALERLKK